MTFVFGIMEVTDVVRSRFDRTEEESLIAGFKKRFPPTFMAHNM